MHQLRGRLKRVDVAPYGHQDFVEATIWKRLASQVRVIKLEAKVAEVRKERAD